MGNLYIQEYECTINQGKVQAGLEPRIASQKVSFTTSAASASFNSATRFIRLWSDIDVWVKFDFDPTAVVTDMPLAAGVPEYFGVNPDHKVAAYDGSS